MLYLRAMKENWKPIKGYEGAYEISDLGNARSVERLIVRKDGIRIIRRGVIIRQRTNQGGYQIITVSSADDQRTISIHRAVAEAFIKQGWDNNTSVVRHKDGNKNNNAAYNLMWENESRNYKAKSVVQLGFDGYYLRRFDSAFKAAKRLDLHQSAISKVCHHKMNSTGGYRFMFESEYLANKLF